MIIENTVNDFRRELLNLGYSKNVVDNYPKYAQNILDYIKETPQKIQEQRQPDEFLPRHRNHGVIKIERRQKRQTRPLNIERAVLIEQPLTAFARDDRTETQITVFLTRRRRANRHSQSFFFLHSIFGFDF